MAIIATAPGVEVQVFVNGQACVEYNDDDEVAAARNVTKYIEAESGANFEFRIRIKPEFAYQDHDLKFYVLVDGTVMCRSVVEKRKVRKDHKLKLESTRFCKNNQWFQRKFTFSNLTIVEGHGPSLDEATVKKLLNLGVLTVNVCRISERHVMVRDSRPEPRMDRQDEISEKALKGRALTHSASLAPQQPIPPVQLYRSHTIDPRTDPLLSFNFKYRSLDALKALRVIPRSPSPVSLEEMPMLPARAHMTREQLLELANRQEELEVLRLRGIKQEVKRERTEDDDDVDDDDIVEIRAVKRERTSRDTETIDLTDD